MPSTSDYAEQLRAAALRVTRPRIAVMEAVHAQPHADTETIFGAVRAGLPEVSRQAVYDVLNALTAVGLVRRIQPSGSVARYESRINDNHHHVVCRSCGVIADVDCAVGEAPCLTASENNGFAMRFSSRRFTEGRSPFRRNLSNTAMRPPGLSTRSASWRPRSGSGITATIKCITTASKDPSANWSTRASIT